MSKYIIIPVEELRNKIKELKKEQSNFKSYDDEFTLFNGAIIKLTDLLFIHPHISLDEKDVEKLSLDESKKRYRDGHLDFESGFKSGYLQAIEDIKQKISKQ